MPRGLHFPRKPRNLVLSARGGVWDNCRPGRFPAGLVFENPSGTARCFIRVKSFLKTAIFAVENAVTLMLSIVFLSHRGAGQARDNKQQDAATPTVTAFACPTRPAGQTQRRRDRPSSWAREISVQVRARGFYARRSSGCSSAPGRRHFCSSAVCRARRGHRCRRRREAFPGRRRRRGRGNCGVRASRRS